MNVVCRTYERNVVVSLAVVSLIKWRLSTHSLVFSNLVLGALFPGFGDGAGKGPCIGRPIRYFDWLIDLGNSVRK